MKKVFWAFCIALLSVVLVVPVSDGAYNVPLPLGGDASGTTAAVVNGKINGTTVPAGGALTTGNSLGVTGAGALSYGPLNLAGGANYVTGSLPTANQVVQSMAGDVTGTTAASVVAKVNGTTVPAGGALTTGNACYISGASACTYSAVNLAGGAGWVSGSLPDGNQAAQTCTGDVTGNTGATVVSAISGVTPIVITPTTLQWLKTTNGAAIKQAAQTTDTPTFDLNMVSQAPFATATGTNRQGGNFNFLIPPDTNSATAQSAFNFGLGTSSNTTPVATFKNYFGSTNAAVYLGATATAPDTTNFAIFGGSGGTTFNSPTGNTLTFSVGGTGTWQTATSSLVQPITDNAVAQGATAKRWSDVETYTASFKGAIDLNSPDTLACGTGGTQTVISAPHPGIIVTSGTLGSNCVLDFSTNASNGIYQLDMSGVTLGATFGVQFKNGTATKTYTSAGVISGTLATVWTHGANTLAVNF